MNTTIYGMSIFARVKKVWVCWSEQYIADSYEDAVDYSRNSGMIDSFSEWLDFHQGYSLEDIFEMSEEDKIKERERYADYVKSRMEDEWEEKEVTI